MNFKSIIRDCLHMSNDQFAAEYGIALTTVEELINSNEIPLGLLMDIVKKSGCSFDELIECTGEESINDEVTTVDPKKIIELSFDSSHTKLECFESWLDFVQKEIALENDTKEWLYCVGSRCIMKYEENNGPNRPSSYFVYLMSDLGINECRLKCIIDNRSDCIDIARNVVVSEMSRLIDEDNLINELIQELRTLHYDMVGGLREQAEELTSATSLGERMLQCKNDKVFVLNELNQAFEVLAMVYRDNLSEETKKIADKLCVFYDTEIHKRISGKESLIPFFPHRVMNRNLVIPYIDSNLYAEISDEEAKRRQRNYNKEKYMNVAKETAKNIFLPVGSTLRQLTGSAEDFGKALRIYVVNHGFVDDYVKKQSNDLLAIIDSYIVSMKSLRREWKKKILELDELVHMDDERLKVLCHEEPKKRWVLMAVERALIGGK